MNGSIGMGVGKLRELEKRATEIVEQARQLNVCAVPRIEFFGGADDGGNKTYDYWEELGFPLQRTRAALFEVMEDDVFGVYATWDGIVVQCHRIIFNDQGNPVEDYGWVIHLSVLLAEERIPEEKPVARRIYRFGERDICHYLHRPPHEGPVFPVHARHH
jgi:hypothetical protein